MHKSALVKKVTGYSKLVKFNFLLLITFVIASTMVVSFAADGDQVTPTATQTSCGAKVSLVLDRSASIGVDAFSGSRANSERNIAAIKTGSGALIDALKGHDSYLDVFAFASVAQRITTDGRTQLTDGALPYVKGSVLATKFKTGANSGDQDAYNDGINAAGEGLTNWEHALQAVDNYSQYLGYPTHVVIFTDGEPTTNIPNANRAIAAGGSYSAAGLPNEDGISPEDLSRAFTVADKLRSKGTKIIAIGVGDVIKPNLDRLAGGAGNVYMAGSFNELTETFKKAASTLCEQTNVILYEGLEKVGNELKPIKLTVNTRAQKSNTPATLVTASGETTGVKDPRWLVSPKDGVKFSGNWDLRGTAVIPNGYRAVSDECKVASDGNKLLTQTTTGAANKNEAHIQGIAGGSWVACTFIVEKALNDGIEIIKDVTPTTAKRGDTVTYSFVVKNTGNTKLTNIRVTDEMLNPTAPHVIHTIAELAPGASSPTFTKTYKIPNNAGNTVHNVAIAKGIPVNEDGTPRPEVTDDDPADVTIPAENERSWTAVKEADKEVVVPGELVTYTITVTNTGNVDLHDIEVSDPTIDFDVVTIDELKVGQSKSVTATYTIPEDFDGDTFRNVALVCVPEQGQDDECKEPEEEVDIARLQITKTANKQTALPGEKVIYTFVVTNTGGVDLDPTPIFDDILGEIGDPGILEPGEKATFTKEYTVPADAEAGDEIVNTATVCAPVPGKTGATLEDTDCKTTCPADLEKTLCDQDDHELIIIVPEIDIVKSADKESATVGETVVYTFVVTNVSDTTISDIEVIDNVLGDLGTIDKLEPGESATKTVSYVVPAEAGTAGTVRNIATACFATPEWDDNCASDDHELIIVGGTVVTTTPTQVKGETLAFTGASSTWLAVVAGIIVAIGTALFLTARKRRGSHS